MMNFKGLLISLLSTLALAVPLSFGQTADKTFNALLVTYLDGKTEQIHISPKSTITFGENTMNITYGDKSSSMSIDGISHCRFKYSESAGISCAESDTAVVLEGHNLIINSDEVRIYGVSGLLLAHIRQQAPINIDINEISDKTQTLIISYADGRTIKIITK